MAGDWGSLINDPAMALTTVGGVPAHTFLEGFT
jgi:hypothetical protein